MTVRENPLQKALRYQTDGLPLNRAIIVRNPDTKEPDVLAFIADLDLDVFIVKLDQDRFVEVWAEGCTHVTLDATILRRITRLIPKGIALWDELCAYWVEPCSCERPLECGCVSETWVGWEHLIERPSNPRSRCRHDPRQHRRCRGRVFLSGSI
mgnify:CR=1 FL=1